MILMDKYKKNNPAKSQSRKVGVLKKSQLCLLCKHLRLKTHNFLSVFATLRENNKCDKQSLPLL